MFSELNSVCQMGQKLKISLRVSHVVLKLKQCPEGLKITSTFPWFNGVRGIQFLLPHSWAKLITDGEPN